MEIIKKFLPVLREQSREIFKDEISDLKINYVSKLLDGGNDYRAYFGSKLKDNQAKEIAARQTLYGPHKDDFVLSAGGKDLKVFGSRGQQRIATLILKIAMWHYMSTLVGEKPILLLDDIMSELDPTNMQKLEDIITNLDTQTFISGTHAEHFSKTIREKSKLVSLL